MMKQSRRCYGDLHKKTQFEPREAPLRKHAYSNVLKISPPKTESFRIEIPMFFLFLLKTLIVGTR